MTTIENQVDQIASNGNIDEKIQALQARKQAQEEVEARGFAEEYQALVAKRGYEVIAVPQYVMNQAGSYELRVSYMVNKVQQQQGA